MAVLHRSTIQASLKQLESYYNELKHVLEGEEVSASEARMYYERPDQFALIDVDIDRLLDAVAHFKVSVDSLRRLNAKALKPRKIPYFPSSEDQY